MRILAVSDLRVHDVSLLERVAERTSPDLIVYAGDDAIRFAEGTNSWSPLARRTRYGLVGVLGNDCDGRHAIAFEQPGCHNLQLEPKLFDDLAILGLEGAPQDDGLGLGSLLYSPEQANAHLKKQRATAGNRKVLLVSHAPPKGILDTSRRYGTDSIGSHVVRAFAEKPRVRAIVCGHVHLLGGNSETVKRCLVVNVASHDVPDSPLRFAVLNWNGSKIELIEHGIEHSFAALRLVSGIGPAGAARLRGSGIRSLDDIVKADDRTLARTPVAARSIRARARAHVEKRPVVILPEATFPRDAVIVDVETSFDKDDPWLIGVKAWGDPEVTQIEDLNAARHRSLLAKVDSTIRRLKRRCFASWGSFDPGSLEASHERVGLEIPGWLASRHGKFVDEQGWIDTYAWVRRVVALPIEDYSIKTVARYFNYKYPEPNLNGVIVGAWYSKYRRDGTTFDVELVRRYNRADVEAVEHVVRAVQALLTAPNAFVEPPAKAAQKRTRRKVRRFP